eukprot:7433558-Alexandrium_andersonii.AAC.1
MSWQSSHSLRPGHIANANTQPTSHTQSGRPNAAVPDRAEPLEVPQEERNWAQFKQGTEMLCPSGHSNTCLLYTSPSPRD